MPGNGTIGGGSSFRLIAATSDKLKKQKGTVEALDEDVAYPFTIHLTFPGGATKDVPITSKNDQIKFEWPWPPPP